MPVTAAFLKRILPPNALAVVLVLTAFTGGVLWGQSAGNVSGNATPATATPGNATTGDATAAGQAPVSTGTSEEQAAQVPKPTQGFVNFESAVGTIREFVDIFLKISWAFVALLALFFLRRPLFELLEELKSAVPTRGLSIDVGTFKLQLTERAPDGLDDVRQLFSRSPFELEDENPHDAQPLVQDIKQQLTVSVSDSVAQFWEKSDRAAAATVAVMRSEREALAALLATAPQPPQLRTAVLRFAKALEASRFREADRFAVIIESHDALAKWLDALEPADATTDEDDCIILLAAGVAWQQNDCWSEAIKTMNRVAWKDEKPFYKPAGAFWLGASYNHLLDSLEGASVESPDFEEKLHAEVDRAKVLAKAIDAQDFSALSVQLPKGYYVREVNKDLGDVLSVVAEYLPANRRRQYLDEGTKYLEYCAQTILGEPPSPLDQNNLADLYRQLGDMANRTENGWQPARTMYRKAHAEIEAALAKEPKDPAFVNTYALLLASEGRYHDAILELKRYSEETALAANAQDQKQYGDNLLLGAKLEVAAHKADDPRGVAFAIKELESLERFLEGPTHQIRQEDVDELRVELAELLAFAYLMLPRGESLALNAFERLTKLSSWRPSSTSELRSRVGYTTAILRSARQQRRYGSVAIAASLRQQAESQIAKVRALLKKLPIDAGDEERQRRNIGSWLDAMSVAQLLAEEHHASHEAGDAADMLKQVGDDVSALAAVVAADPDQRSRSAYRRIVARHALLDARLLIAKDKMLEAADTVTNAEDRLRAARGVRGDVECLAELEQGWLRLTSARLERGDPEVDFVQAAAAFERAVGLDVASLRREAARALAVAYSMRASLPRKKAKAPTKE